MEIIHGTPVTFPVFAMFQVDTAIDSIQPPLPDYVNSRFPCVNDTSSKHKIDTTAYLLGQASFF